MIAWASPNTIAAPAMSFFISRMPEAVFEVEPARIKTHPFADRARLHHTTP
jgi:hypothetical protein